MTQPANSMPLTKRPGRFRLTPARCLILVVVVAVTAVVVHWLWPFNGVPKPPNPSLAGLDPEVVQAIEKARAAVEHRGWQRCRESGAAGLNSSFTLTSPPAASR